MPPIEPAVAAIRGAARACLRDRADGVLVACSGGADSLALAAAVAFVAARLDRPVGLITVDHQLQDGSAQRAAIVAQWAIKEGFDPVLVRPVGVGGRPGGPEAAARAARYEALVAAAGECGAGAVLLGHTRDDQAETVLLALLRGSGPHALAGMAPSTTRDGVCLIRPLLGVSRAQTRAACVFLGLSAWDDPHNQDLAFARPRARDLLASLAASLGPATTANLARTARLVAADTAVLDDLAGQALPTATGHEGDLDATVLAALPAAIRGRVLHAWARSLGCPGSALGLVHIDALDALVLRWRGQGPVHLPGGILVVRRAGRLQAQSDPAGADGARPVAPPAAEHRAGCGHG